jgi:hypothetical protein
MTFGTDWRYDAGSYDHGRSRKSRPQRVVAGAGLACVALLCAWTMCSSLVGPATNQIDVVGSRGDKLAVVKPKPPVAANSHVALFDTRLFDARYSLGLAPRMFAQTAPRANAVASASSQPTSPHAQQIASTPSRGDQVAQSEAPSPPLPPQLRLPRIASLNADAHGDRSGANKRADTPSLFEKLFGKPQPLTLAYAAAEDGASGDATSVGSGRYDRLTAVYDISAHRVYMPDGTALEAHSGYGSMLDDPRHADAKDRGVTPPDVYDLEPRESLFHGVQALRLIPVDEKKVFGRSGLLAHSYMLGPNGDSNGCVSFKDYDAFLQAYMNHRIKRLVVVARLD